MSAVVNGSGGFGFVGDNNKPVPCYCCDKVCPGAIGDHPFVCYRCSPTPASETVENIRNAFERAIGDKECYTCSTRIPQRFGSSWRCPAMCDACAKEHGRDIKVSLDLTGQVLHVEVPAMDYEFQEFDISEFTPDEDVAT